MKREVLIEMAKKSHQIRRENKILPRVIKSGVWIFGDEQIECAVLGNGTRLFTQKGMASAIGKGVPSVKKEKTNLEKLQIPPFISDSLAKSMPRELLEELQPIDFIMLNGKRAIGYRATALPKLMWQIVDTFKERGTPAQKAYCSFCDKALRAISTVGIIAIVDEITGYQFERARDALQKILQKYMADELTEWVKIFPDSFYQQIYRLKGWGKCLGNKRAPAVASITVNIVYARLAPEIIEELRKQMPKTETGNRKGKLHQMLNEDIGKKELKNLLAKIEALQILANTWGDFISMLDKVAPVKSIQSYFPDPEKIEEDMKQINCGVIPD